MLIGQGRQIPTGKLWASGFRHLAQESPQQRTHRKRHRKDTQHFHTSRKPELVLCFVLLHPRSPGGFVDLRVLVGLQHNFNINQILSIILSH